jgi:hypothetical protein
MNLHGTAIGVVIHNGTITLAVRRGNVMEEPFVGPAEHPIAAAALILDVKAKYRHDQPVAFIHAAARTDHVLEEILRFDELSVDQAVDGLEPALNPRYANRRSELFMALRRSVEEGALCLPPAYNEQLMAFEPGERERGLWVPPPQDVAAKLGRFPSLAIAAALAAQSAYPGFGVGKADVAQGDDR